MAQLSELIPTSLQSKLEQDSQAKLSAEDMAARSILQRINKKLKQPLKVNGNTP